MARVNVLAGKLRAWSIASLASGMVILCLLGLFFPALRDMVPPPPTPEPQLSTPPGTPPVVPPSMSSTPVPTPKVSGPPGDDGQPDRPDPPPWTDPGDKR